MLNAFKVLNFDDSAFFVNKLTRRYHNFIRTMVEHQAFKGFTGYLLGVDQLKYTGSWMFDMFAIASVFGWIAFIIFTVVLFIRYASYYKNSDDDKTSKIMLLAVILSIMLFTGTCYNSTPYFDNNEYLPLFFLSPFIVLIFFYGYMGKNEEEIKA